MRVFKFAAIIFGGALILLAGGCASTPEEPLPLGWTDMSEVQPAQNLPPFKLTPADIAVSPPPVTNSIPPPVTNNSKPRVAPL